MDKNIFSVPNNTRTIDDFKARLIQGGARPNLFEVEMAFPTEDIFPELGDTTFRMMIKGAQLPASNIAEVIVPFRGRQLKVAGEDLTHGPLQSSMTVISNFAKHSRSGQTSLLKSLTDQEPSTLMTIKSIGL